MLTIRLTRKGKKNQPFFRLVVIDKRRSTKGGRAVEDLGYVDPLKKRKNFKKERIQYWLSKGAKPSATIHNFLVSEKIIEGKKINVSKKSKKPAEVKAVAPATTQAPAPAATPEVKPSELAPVEAPKEELKPAEEIKPVELALVEAQKDLPAPVDEPKPVEAPKEEKPLA